MFTEVSKQQTKGLKRLHSFDAFSKTADDYAVRTYTGAMSTFLYISLTYFSILMQ